MTAASKRIQREIPILMKDYEVRATLSDDKTQTRRALKPQPDFLYEIVGDNITELFFNKETALDLDSSSVRRRSSDNTYPPQLGLHGGFGWADLLTQENYRHRENDFGGLVSFSRVADKPGILKCLLVPRRKEIDGQRSPSGLYGVPWNPHSEVSTDPAPGREQNKQFAGQFGLGDTTGELVRPRGTRAGNEGRKASPVQVDGYRKRPYPMGHLEGTMQSASRRANSWDEPVCNTGVRFYPGLRLWVKETWSDQDCCEGECFYRATMTRDTDYDAEEIAQIVWRPSIFMPRWASRITLEVTDVRVQRLQDISEEDALAEGVPFGYDHDPIAEVHGEKIGRIYCSHCGGWGTHGALGPNLGVTEVDCAGCDTAVKLYRNLWNYLNDDNLWDTNPWVVAISYRRIDPTPSTSSTRETPNAD